MEIYGQRSQKTRDVYGEILDILHLLNPKPESTVMVVGNGTAESSIAAARHCSNVHSMDVSSSMLS
jgi:ubiquinone/menaquinone biosynthesis C-methylase UbiE